MNLNIAQHIKAQKNWNKKKKKKNSPQSDILQFH